MRPPESPQKLYERACSSDEITVNTWRETWKRNVKANHEKYGPFAASAIGELFGKERLKPVIVVGSGPDLATNVDQLKDTKGIALISVLHNYHYLEDRGIRPDYYVTLDAGDVTLEEIYEGGTKTPEEYLESTKDKTLLAFIGSSPKLLAAWKGKVIWFAAPLPDKQLTEDLKAVEDFTHLVSTGGNVLGASFYIAKAILGAGTVIFVGASFCFSYDNKFHPWDSKYDKDVGRYQTATDVFGMPRKTWASYYQFKCWFESRVCRVPGIYINCTEGGLFGAYPEGNIQQLIQMSLKDCIGMYSIADQMQVDFDDEAKAKAKERVQSPEAIERREKVTALQAQIDQIMADLKKDNQIEERKVLC
jgi:hypothetical protein